MKVRLSTVAPLVSAIRPVMDPPGVRQAIVDNLWRVLPLDERTNASAWHARWSPGSGEMKYIVLGFRRKPCASA